MQAADRNMCSTDHMSERVRGGAEHAMKRDAEGLDTRSPQQREHEHEHAGGHGHGHDHGIAPNADRRYLLVALGLILAFMVAEVIVGISSGSLVLLADAGHMLTDVLAIGAALWAASLAKRPATNSFTFGLKRAEILSAAINAITLLIIAAVIAYEAIRRLIDPPAVEGLPVLVMALVGVVVNVAATLVLARANRTSMNVEGAFQHILTDLYAFIGTAIAGVVLLLTGFTRADAIASLVVVVLLAIAGVRLLRASGRVLLQATPEGLDLVDVRRHLLALEHVHAVHDLHAWTVTSGQPTLSAHIVVDDDCFTSGRAPRVLDDIQSCLTAHFDLDHSTFQLEGLGQREREHATHE